MGRVSGCEGEREGCVECVTGAAGVPCRALACKSSQEGRPVLSTLPAGRPAVLEEGLDDRVVAGAVASDDLIYCQRRDGPLNEGGEPGDGARTHDPSAWEAIPGPRRSTTIALERL